MTDNTQGSPDIIINLYDDWIEILRGQLRAEGYADSPSDKPLEVAIKFLNVRLRDIQPKPRTVNRASDLTFDPKYQSAVDAIQQKATAGQSLTPHLSKLLLDANYHDPLLNDWGLHHLHLSTNIGPSGFVDRTGPLLFARVTEESFHMVAVLAHGGWTNRDLLEKILRDWPSLLEPYEMRGIVGLVNPVTERDHAKLRKANVQTFTQLSNDKVYFPMGGGVTTAGSNVRTVLEHDRWAKALRAIEGDVRAKLDELRAKLPDGKVFGVPPTFRLMFENGDPVVVELVSGVGFRYPL